MLKGVINLSVRICVKNLCNILRMYFCILRLYTQVLIPRYLKYFLTVGMFQRKTDSSECSTAVISDSCLIAFKKKILFNFCLCINTSLFYGWYKKNFVGKIVCIIRAYLDGCTQKKYRLWKRLYCICVELFYSYWIIEIISIKYNVIYIKGVHLIYLLFIIMILLLINTVISPIITTLLTVVMIGETGMGQKLTLPHY